METSEKPGEGRGNLPGGGRPPGAGGEAGRREPDAKAFRRKIWLEMDKEKALRRKAIARGVMVGYVLMALSVALFLSQMDGRWLGRNVLGALLAFAACASVYTLAQSFRLMAFHRSLAGSISFLVLLGLLASEAYGFLYPCGFRPYRANESSAIASMKTLVTAEEQYRSINHDYASLTQLSADTPPYLDNVLARGRKSGYSFTLTVGTPADGKWSAIAIPLKPGVTGVRRFFADASGNIRFHAERMATSSDSPIE